MPKVHKVKTEHEELRFFHCPGCKRSHAVRVSGDGAWGFNWNDDKPTFTPSVLVTQPPSSYRCHSFVRDGKIQFLGDCSHELKGQTIELPEWDEK